jgi:hypothetical protein
MRVNLAVVVAQFGLGGRHRPPPVDDDRFAQPIGL